jgi:hypothetical protein
MTVNSKADRAISWECTTVLSAGHEDQLRGMRNFKHFLRTVALVLGGASIGNLEHR